MAHPSKKLTAVSVRQARQPGRYADGGGLYLVVESETSRYWVLRTTIKGQVRSNTQGKVVPVRIDMGLGSVADVSLAEARELATKYRKMARDGINPIEARKAERRTIPTFEQAARDVHEENAPTWRNPKHADQWLNTLRDYAFPHFGPKTVDLVGRADVRQALSEIWLSKPETARRVRQRIGAVLDWAIANEFREEANPCPTIARSLPKQTDTTKHHEAMPVDDVAEFVQRMRAFDAALTVRLAAEFLILTNTRTGDVRGAVWDEIDTVNAVWSIPGERTKKNRPHRVPLSPRAVEILTEARRLSNGDLVFPGRNKDRPLSNMAIAMMMRRMGETATPHGFRSCFRDWASERTSFANEVVEASMSHAVKSATERAYFRSDLFALRRDLMNQWAEFVTAPVEKVVEMRAGV